MYSAVPKPPPPPHQSVCGLTGNEHSPTCVLSLNNSGFHLGRHSPSISCRREGTSLWGHANPAKLRPTCPVRDVVCLCCVCVCVLCVQVCGVFANRSANLLKTEWPWLKRLSLLITSRGPLCVCVSLCVSWSASRLTRGRESGCPSTRSSLGCKWGRGLRWIPGAFCLRLSRSGTRLSPLSQRGRGMLIAPRLT